VRSRTEIIDALTGPIPTLRTTFRRDGSIDFCGLKNSIEFDITAGCKSIMLTPGDTLYSILTDKEVGEIVKFVVEEIKSRVLIIVAEKGWWTGKAVEFAKYCNEIGIDLLMVSPPNWANSCTVESFVEHYKTVARYIPVMLVTNVFFTSQEIGLEAIKILRDTCDNILAIKDDLCGEFARKVSILVNGHWAVIAGGQKQNHMNMLPYGCNGYLSTFITFKPSITHRYWKCIKKNNLIGAREIIINYDMPLFDYLFRLQGGFDAGIHGILELYGIAQRWRRKPYYSLNDKEMEKLSDFLKKLYLL
jgi:4-hydroxy-tetrahydrodipicolinate synthase